VAKRKATPKVDVRRLRRNAEAHQREFEVGISSRREALECLRNLAATWKWMEESFDTQAEAHAHFWARLHRSSTCSGSWIPTVYASSRRLRPSRGAVEGAVSAATDPNS
jgi:hypothetical protein